MKTPDIIDRILNDTNIEDAEEHFNLSEDLRKWFKWDEYLTIDYDTEKDTMTVKKDRR
jgi:hypothetical protein